MGGQDYDGNYHYCIFNFQYLRDLLESVGFADVVRMPGKHLLINARKPIESLTSGITADNGLTTPENGNSSFSAINGSETPGFMDSGEKPVKK